MKVYWLRFNGDILPYIELIGGFKIKFIYGKEQINFPYDQKAYIKTPKPIKSSFWYTYKTLIISENLFPIYQKSLINYAQILPLNIENNGNGFLINIIKLGNEWLSKDETLFVDNSDHESKKGKFIHEREINKSKLYALNAVFLKNQISAPVFNILHNNEYLGPFCTFGMFPEEEEFLALVLKHKMLGLELYECGLI